jgi:hypothetical protein
METSLASLHTAASTKMSGMIGTGKYRWIEPAACYVGAVILCMILLWWILGLSQADFQVPFADRGDVIQNCMLIKGMTETGWVWSNPHLGAPFGTQLYDFPFFDDLGMALMKLISLCSSNFAVILNSYFLLTFPLTVVSSLLVLRTFKVSYPAAAVSSLLFAFLPFHFQRGESHLFVASYFVIPLITMLVLWVWTENPLVAQASKYSSLVRSKGTAAIVACILIGSAFVYYIFFGCYFLLLVGIASAARFRNPKQLAWGIGLAGAIVLVYAINLSPTIYYGVHHGKNLEVGKRDAAQAEVLGLKLTQLLLPISTHRLEAFQRLRRHYDESTEQNESATANMGILADVGFLCLLGWLFCSFPGSDDGAVFDALALLSIAAVLLGTVGGLGALFNYLVYPQIRSYNRISIFIAFFSLFALALLLDRLRQLMSKTAAGGYGWYVVLVIVLIVGILDQTSPSFAPDYDELAKRFWSDQRFVSQVESRLPAEAMVFEFPNVGFPEMLPTGNMHTYDELIPYLHSRSIRWSAGAMRGRPQSLWPASHRLNIYQVRTESGPYAQQVSFQAIQNLVLAGFRGIVIDREGFVDVDDQIVSELKAILGETSLESDGKRYVFFDLSSFREALRTKYTPEQWEIAQREVLEIPITREH